MSTDETRMRHYDEFGWCRCTCGGCAPVGCSHESNPDTESCDVRFGGTS